MEGSAQDRMQSLAACGSASLLQSYLPSIGFQDQLLSQGLAVRIGVSVHCFIWGVLIAPSVGEGRFLMLKGDGALKVLGGTSAHL